jgi:hypothetical protein
MFSVSIIFLFTCSSTSFSQMRPRVGPCRVAGGWVCWHCERRLGECFQGCLRVRPILVCSPDAFTNLSSSLGVLVGSLPRVRVVVKDVTHQVITSSFELRRPRRLITLLTLSCALAVAALVATCTGLSWRSRPLTLGRPAAPTAHSFSHALGLFLPDPLPSFLLRQ